jgi:hypothetical protein
VNRDRRADLVRVAFVLAMLAAFIGYLTILAIVTIRSPQ